MLNRFVGVGRLGRSPESKNGSGTPRTKFSVAAETSWAVKGQSKTRTDWIPCIAWGSVAEQAARLQKGDVVYLDGRFSTSSWVDKATGQKRYMSEITVEVLRSIPFSMSGSVVMAVAGMLATVRLLLSQSAVAGESRRAATGFPGGDEDYDRQSGDEFDRYREQQAKTRAPQSAGVSDFDGPNELARPAPGEGDDCFPGGADGGFPGGEDDDVPF